MRAQRLSIQRADVIEGDRKLVQQGHEQYLCSQYYVSVLAGGEEFLSRAFMTEGEAERFKFVVMRHGSINPAKWRKSFQSSY